MSALQPIQQELAALRHELRRVNDGLERNPTHDLEKSKRQLQQNIELCKQQINQHEDSDR